MNKLNSVCLGSAALGFVACALALSGCGARTLLEHDACERALVEASDLECVAPQEDACAMPELVAPVCDATTKRVACPTGSRPLVRVAPDAASSCLPFSDPDGPIAALGSSLVRVPTDDGRCLWIAEDVRTTNGEDLRNVAFETDPSLPFGTCPTEARLASHGLASAVTVEGPEDPSVLVQISSAFRKDGATRVLYRLFQLDASAPFGVANLGSGVGRWDASTQRIVVSPPTELAFSVEENIGDAALVEGGLVYVYGCPYEDGLTNQCLVMRVPEDAADWRVFSSTNGWVVPVDAELASPIFSSGPWVSTVARRGAARLLHLYAIGFGRTLETSSAQNPEGPWTNGPTLAGCDLPSDDADAFCAGPVVHDELTDPTRPTEAWVSYGVGTTAPDQAERRAANPRAYWTRLARVSLPFE